MVHWSRDVCGPVGSCTASHENTASEPFNSPKWLGEKQARLGGFVVHADEYVNCMQIVGYVEKTEGSGG